MRREWVGGCCPRPRPRVGRQAPAAEVPPEAEQQLLRRVRRARLVRLVRERRANGKHASHDAADRGDAASAVRPYERRSALLRLHH